MLYMHGPWLKAHVNNQFLKIIYKHEWMDRRVVTLYGIRSLTFNPFFKKRNFELAYNNFRTIFWD